MEFRRQVEVEAKLAPNAQDILTFVISSFRIALKLVIFKFNIFTLKILLLTADPKTGVPPLITDFLTKPLIGQQFYKLRDLLLGYTTL